ncbi:MAG: ModD protein [Candidatus Accumulibacter sp.]|jgi:molybdenum transport protein|nr:ModD protein [Candidatus Accumulibacter necessarius]
MSPYRLPDAFLESLLQEDSPCGDATTFTLAIGHMRGHLVFRARGEMVLCGSEEAQRLGELRGLTAVGPMRVSGSPLAAGDEILCLGGDAASLHLVWKTAQTLMEYLSGIAIVTAARRGHTAASVVCTRKNFPGTKAAAIKAVFSGGASPHRLSLSETLLVFPEHRAFLRDEAPGTTIERLRQCWPERAVVVEVNSESEARRWIDAGADILQLEKMPVEKLRQIAAYAAASRQATKIAAAGGIDVGNAAAYAEAGAQTLVTSAPFSARPRDVAVTMESG